MPAGPSPRHPYFARRTLLQAGGVGLLGLGIDDLARIEALGDEQGVSKESAAPKSVIFVFLSGGASHLDMFDLKPEAPDSIRGEFRPIATQTPGIEISEHLPLLAQRSRLWAMCRSLTHKSDDHEEGHQMMLSGRSDLPPGFIGIRSRATHWPSIAALANYGAARRDNLPPAVVVPEKLTRTDNLEQFSGQFAGLLGSHWDPWFVEAAPWCQRGWGPCPNCYDGVINDGTPHRRSFSRRLWPFLKASALIGCAIGRPYWQCSTASTRPPTARYPSPATTNLLRRPHRCLPTDARARRFAT
jgi:hypothetical protein